MDGHENDALDGATPTTPAKGGIFSGSDTRVETENLPEVPQVAQQAPMSSISPAIRTASTVTGDLQLGGTTKKKKWPFIALGVVAVVALIVGGVIMASNQKSGDSAESEARIALNQFSNYYLFGTDSTSPVQGSYDKNTVYKAVTAIEERDAEFFNKAKEYYDTFMQAYEQSMQETQKDAGADTVDDYLSGDIVSFTQMFDFVYRLAVAPPLTSEEIFDVFINIGLEPTRQFINNYYAELSNTSYELGARYAKERTTYDLAQVDQYYIYQDSNCIDGEDIKDNCSIDTKKYDVSRIEEAERIANSDILRLPDEVVENSIEQLYLIQKEDI